MSDSIELAHLASARRPRFAAGVARVIGDRRGAVYLETLVAYLPLLGFCFCVAELGNLFAAKLTVQRAASAAVRAAVVVLPDDGAYYEDDDNARLNDLDPQRTGARRWDVDVAANLVTLTAPSLGAASVRLDGTPSGNQRITAKLSVPYRCGFGMAGLLGLVCGLDGTIDLEAQAALPYQGAKFSY